MHTHPLNPTATPRQPLSWPGIALLVALSPLSATGIEPPDNIHDTIAEHLETCGPQYADVNARIDDAATGDAGYYPVEEYPWVRTDRLMASFVGELDSTLALDVWLAQLRDNEGFARNIELKNLGMPLKERSLLLNDLRLCAVWLSMQAAADPETRKPFLEAVRAPAELDPADFAPVDDRQAAKNTAEVEADFRSAAAADETRTVAWHAERQPDMKSIGEVLAIYTENPKDVLGRVGMVSSSWDALAHFYAPRLVTAADRKTDQLGAPAWTGDQQPGIDREDPVVHWQATYARYGDDSLIQLNYMLWFGDTRGRLNDGLIWRVTLDPTGQPLVFESMNMDGTKHLWFPTKRLTQRGQPAGLIPAGQVSDAVAGLRLEAETRHVTGLVEADGELGDDRRSYRLAPYEALLSLPTPDGGTRSLFDPEGFVAGVPRADDTPGMRQLGRHSLAPREAWFFDDPALLARTFDLSIITARAPDTNDNR